MSNPYAGIYYVFGAVLFPTQIVVGRELKWENHIWLKALSDRIRKQDMKELLVKINSLTQKFDRELADSVLEVSIRANMRIIRELRGENQMCMEVSLITGVPKRLYPLVPSRSDFR